MASTFDSTINSFYLAYYGRPADPSGLAFWSMQLEAAHGDFGAIAAAFAGSEEAQVRFGSSDATARITQIYQQLYNRAPDAEGLAFWTKAIASGAMTMADAAIQILHGAQGGDATLATARQAAAAAFTAEVAKSGVAYDGYAAIEAARVLVKAVGTGTTAADVDAMVAATAKLVQIAHDNPKVVEAIAVGTTLEKLFDTARGHAEPAKLVQALADVAQAAAGAPSTLESLLRGGGMAKVLDVMPAAATLGDVVAALAKGGLPAAIEVVYPTAPAEPVVPLTMKFVSVSEDGRDTVHDNVTNVDSADVTFSYSRALKSTQHVEWTSDGGATWHTDGFDVVAKGRTIVIHGVDLTGEQLPPPPPPRLDPEAGNRTPVPQNATTTVQVRVVESGKVVASASQDIVHDGFVPAPAVQFDTSNTHLDMVEQGVILTNNASFTVTNFEQGAKLGYLVTGNGANVSEWTGIKPTLKEGVNTFSVRAVDAAGNVAVTDVVVKLDTAGPTTTAILALDADTGASSTDQLTSVGKIDVSGLDTHADTAWEYSLDQGKTWTSGAPKDDSGNAILDLSAQEDGAHKVWVRQYDAAGNLGATVTALDFTLDTQAPDVTFTFAGVTGNDDSQHPASTKSDIADVTFKIGGTVAADDIVQWRTGNGTWQDAKAGDISGATFTLHDLDLTSSDPNVQVRIGDAAGNFTQAVGKVIDGPYNPVPFSVTPVQGGLELKGVTAGTAYINTGFQQIKLTLDAAGTDQIAGVTGLHAQTQVVEGVIGSSGIFTQPPLNAVKYVLGTDNGDTEMEGSNVWGFGGNDEITGLNSDDHLYGGDGNDTITGGKGIDVLSGGKGADVFNFGAGDSMMNGYDTITDFDRTDTLAFTDANWNAAKMTIDSTFYTSLEALENAAFKAMGYPDVETKPAVYAGQWGADTYIFAKNDANDEFLIGASSMVKLANFAVIDLYSGNVKGISTELAAGTSTVIASGEYLAGGRGQVPYYVKGWDNSGYPDFISGGSGNDVLKGGESGDAIYLHGGHDTLVYVRASESNLGSLVNHGMDSFDTIAVAPAATTQIDAFTVDFGIDVLGVQTVSAQAPSQDSGLIAILDQLYHQKATSRYDALLVNMDDDSSYLVLNNGDDKIDQNDYVVKIVGNGDIALDEAHNVIFSFKAPD